MERAIGRSLTTAEAMGNDGGDSRRPLVDHQPTVDDPPNIFATPVAPEFPESSTIDPQATSETHLPQLALTIPSSDFLANVGENPFSTPTTPLITENEAHEDVLVREEPTLTLKSSLKNNKSKSRSRVSIVEDPAIGAFKVSEDAPPLPTPALSVAPAMDFAYVNPLFAGSTTTPLKGTPKSSTVSKPKSVKKGAGPRRMSLGAALCIPPRLVLTAT
ncbi:hypothetical protein BC829DRAFT_50012 [Chytridium lagenaria]|nr:hypothetical protein BC829DRAFT_50012 [Chytridium lagenaria]